MTGQTDRTSEELNEQANSQFSRLQENLKEYDSDDVSEREILREDANSLADTEKEEKYVLSKPDAKDLLSFYITTSAMIEKESILTINAHVFNFDLNNRGSIDFLENHLTQHDREEMLYCLGIIDEGLKGELARLRKRRNDLAHSSHHNTIDEPERLMNDLKRAKKAKDQLKSIGQEVEIEALGAEDQD